MKRIGVVGIPKGWSTERLLASLQRKTGYSLLIDMGNVRLDLDSRKAWYKGQDLTELDAIIVKKIAPSYSPDALDRMEMVRFLHRLGMPVFSNPDSMFSLIDRLSCTTRLRLGNMPMPPTIITEDVEEAVAAVDTFGKAVFKPLYSSKAKGMTVIESGPDAVDEVHDFKSAGNKVMYIQKMVSYAAGRLDLGVSFLGGQYLATYARKGSGDSWDTTTRSGGKYVPYEPSKEIIDLAYKAQGLFPEMAFTCVDVVETDHGAEIYEVSAFGGFRGLLESANMEAADLYVDYVLEKLK